jgi:hypothetical protein
MGSEDSKWKDPQWRAAAIGYEFRPEDERRAISYLTICYVCRKPISLKKFAFLYDWTRDKAQRFLRRAGVKIDYSKGKEMGRSACGYLVLLPANERNPKTKHLRIVTHKQNYYPKNKNPTH